MNNIDLEQLLVKYIDWVGYCEGISFLRGKNPYRPDHDYEYGPPKFTDDEWQYLQRLAEEDEIKS